MELPVRSIDETDLTQVLSPPQSSVLKHRLSKRHRPRPSKRRPVPPPATNRPALLDYWDLTKPEITFLVTLSSLAGFLLGSPEDVNGWLLGYTLIGTALSSGGGAVLNHYLERHLDALMRRTAHRPLPAGRLSPRVALPFGLVLIVTGIATILLLVNLLTAVLAALTVALYLLVYTPLKQTTKYNTFVGSIPGALPALGGWTAATGTLGLGGWTLFAILVLWQMPHFLSLAWIYRKDYARAGYRMLPVVEPDGVSTARQTLLFTLLLVLVSTLPTVVGVTGWVYLAGALVLSVRFLLPAYAFYRSRTTHDARRVLIGSILYIPLLVVLIFVDRLI
ncbi:MAG: heme o synthase [Rhodothermales bacterium]